MKYLVVREKVRKGDPALSKGGRGDRKLVVKKMYPDTEVKAQNPDWVPCSEEGEKTPVLDCRGYEVAFDTQKHEGCSHYHEKDEMYVVLEGKMCIVVDGEELVLPQGDIIIVLAGTNHQVLPKYSFSSVVIRIGEGEKIID